MSSPELVFLKLGGSLITDKTQVETIRGEVLSRLASEIREAFAAKPDLRVVLGHGSGSYGHVAANKHGTRKGVRGIDQWQGFAEVSSAAARLNAQVRETLLLNHVPVVSLQPSASAECQNGQIVTMSTKPVKLALEAGIVPIVYGDVAFDSVLGGTIISTEEILSYLAAEFQPSWLLLAGETEGVLTEDGQLIPRISRENIRQVQNQLGSSRGTDVTGGMAGKVYQMLDLVEKVPNLSVLIFSGLKAGNVRDRLLGNSEIPGTIITK
jgi:isopentenyl phosphate kinase